MLVFVYRSALAPATTLDPLVVQHQKLRPLAVKDFRQAGGLDACRTIAVEYGL